MNRPTHFEILGEDIHKLANFYKDIFGWEINTWEGGEPNYLLVTTGPDSAPGINGGLMGRAFKQNVIITHDVENLDASVEKIKKGGGKVVDGPNEVPSVGMHCYCEDPQGNLFGIIQNFEQ